MGSAESKVSRWDATPSISPHDDAEETSTSPSIPTPPQNSLQSAMTSFRPESPSNRAPSSSSSQYALARVARTPSQLWSLLPRPVQDAIISTIPSSLTIQTRQLNAPSLTISSTMTADTQLAQGRSFHYFKKLPIELRLMIWKYAANNTPGRYFSVVPHVRGNRVPAVLQVNREARQELAKYYGTLRSRLTPVNAINSVHFNHFFDYEKDTLFWNNANPLEYTVRFNGTSMLRWFTKKHGIQSLVPIMDLRKLERLALYATNVLPAGEESTWLLNLPPTARPRFWRKFRKLFANLKMFCIAMKTGDKCKREDLTQWIEVRAEDERLWVRYNPECWGLRRLFMQQYDYGVKNKEIGELEITFLVGRHEIADSFQKPLVKKTRGMEGKGDLDINAPAEWEVQRQREGHTRERKLIELQNERGGRLTTLHTLRGKWY